MGSTTHSGRKKSANLVSTNVQPEPATPPSNIKSIVLHFIKKQIFFGLCPVPASSPELMCSTVPLKVKEPRSCLCS